MSLRGLLALLLALAAAVALVVFLKAPPEKPPDASPDTPLCAPFSEGAVRRIELACGESPVILERSGTEGWRLNPPPGLDADPRAVHVLVTAIQEARARKVIAPPGADAASYGLTPAACTATLVLSGGAGQRDIKLGRTSPVGVERYARDPEGRIVFVDGSLASALGRTASALLEKRLVPVPAESVSRMELAGPNGPLVLVRLGEIWRMEAPDRDEASRAACEQLARAITTIELSDLRSITMPARGPGDRRIALRIFAADRPAPIEAFIAAAGVLGRRLAWRDGGAFAGLIAESSMGDLDRPPQGYRDDHVASFSAPDVRSVTIERGGAVLRIERAGEGAPWSARDGASAPTGAGHERVDALIDSIRWLRGSGFLPAPPPTPATGTIVVRDVGKELAHLEWGPLPPEAAGKESIWVATPARPGVVFRMEARAFGPIPARSSDLTAPRAEAKSLPKP